MVNVKKLGPYVREIQEAIEILCCIFFKRRSLLQSEMTIETEIEIDNDIEDGIKKKRN